MDLVYDKSYKSKFSHLQEIDFTSRRGKKDCTKVVKLSNVGIFYFQELYCYHYILLFAEQKNIVHIDVEGLLKHI